MSNIERNIAVGIVTNLSDEQITATEKSRPGFKIKFIALKRHLSAEIPDEQFVLNQIAVRTLVRSVLGDPETYKTAVRLESLREVNSRFDRILGDLYKQIAEKFKTDSLSEAANARKPVNQYLKDQAEYFRNGLG